MCNNFCKGRTWLVNLDSFGHHCCSDPEYLKKLNAQKSLIRPWQWLLSPVIEFSIDVCESIIMFLDGKKFFIRAEYFCPLFFSHHFSKMISAFYSKSRGPILMEYLWSARHTCYITYPKTKKIEGGWNSTTYSSTPTHRLTQLIKHIENYRKTEISPWNWNNKTRFWNNLLNGCFGRFPSGDFNFHDFIRWKCPHTHSNL